MFNVNYSEDGEIVSYQEGPERTTDVNCRTLSFLNPVPGFIDYNGQITMKVKNGKLVLITPNEIPDPLPDLKDNSHSLEPVISIYTP